ncbi:hypothetical protein GGR55DRAFT_679955 [Xylaria sp. FL0064]|nr:hypothetical protein GGR55DRAFT_679955 [Xylaria sp. FL0064]
MLRARRNQTGSQWSGLRWADSSSSSSSTSSQANCAPQFTFQGLMDFSFSPVDSTEDLGLSNESAYVGKLDFSTVEQANTTKSSQQLASQERCVQASLLTRSNDSHTEPEGCVLNLPQANAERYQHLAAVKKVKYMHQVWQTLLVSHRLLRTLGTLPDNMPFQDEAVLYYLFSHVTLVSSKFTPLFENLGTLDRTLVDNPTEWTQAALPSLRIGAFALDA